MVASLIFVKAGLGIEQENIKARKKVSRKGRARSRPKTKPFPRSRGLKSHINWQTQANIKCSAQNVPLVTTSKERNNKHTDASEEGKEHKRSISLGANATAMHHALVSAPLIVLVFPAAPADKGIVPSRPISRSVIAVDALKGHREGLKTCQTSSHANRCESRLTYHARSQESNARDTIKDPSDDTSQLVDEEGGNTNHRGDDTESSSESSVACLRWDLSIFLLSCQSDREDQHNDAEENLVND